MNEIPTINTHRRWEDMTLPDSVSVADLDAIIFSFVRVNWRKVALIVGQTLTECIKRALPIDDEMIGTRIQALAEADRLDSQGDLRIWRFSEVRVMDNRDLDEIAA